MKPGSITKGVGILTLCRVGGYAMSFMRNLIIARFLSKDDYGLLSILWATLFIVDMNSRVTIGQQVVQAKDGDSKAFLSSAHFTQFGVGIFSSILLVLIAYPIATLMGIPELWWAFAMLGLAPTFYGLSHLDLYVNQKRMHFTPYALADFIPQLVVTVIAIPLLLWLKDFRAPVIIEILRIGIGVLISHFFAKTAFRWNWDKVIFIRIMRFGWPLIVGGLLLFCSQQATRIAVGAFYSLAELAPFALGISLVSIPFFIFAQVAQSAGLASLSRQSSDLDQFNHSYTICSKCAAICGSLLLLPLIIGGEQIMVLLYGSKYQGSGALLGILGTAVSIRFLLFTPNLGAMALGDTRNLMYGNLLRVIGLPLVILVALAHLDLRIIALCGLIAEIMALIGCTWLLRVRLRVSPRLSMSSIAYLIAFNGLGLAISQIISPAWSIIQTASVTAGVWSLAALSAWILFPEISSIVRMNVKKLALKIRGRRQVVRAQ